MHLTAHSTEKYCLLSQLKYIRRDALFSIHASMWKLIHNQQKNEMGKNWKKICVNLSRRKVTYHLGLNQVLQPYWQVCAYLPFWVLAPFCRCICFTMYSPHIIHFSWVWFPDKAINTHANSLWRPPYVIFYLSSSPCVLCVYIYFYRSIISVVRINLLSPPYFPYSCGNDNLLFHIYPTFCRFKCQTERSFYYNYMGKSIKSIVIIMIQRQ